MKITTMPKSLKITAPIITLLAASVAHSGTSSLNLGYPFSILQYSDPMAAAEARCKNYAANSALSYTGVGDFTHEYDTSDGGAAYSYRCVALNSDGEDAGSPEYITKAVAFCDAGYIRNNGDNFCTKEGSRRDPAAPNGPGGSCKASNPIIILTGEKQQIEIDRNPDSYGALGLVRQYASQGVLKDGMLGKGVWRLKYYDSRVVSNYVPQSGVRKTVSLCGSKIWRSGGGVETLVGNSCDEDIPTDLDSDVAEIHLWDGKKRKYQKLNGTLIGTANSEGHLSERFDSLTFQGWHYRNSNNDVFSYDVNGRLVEISFQNGAQEFLYYDITQVDGGDDNSTTLDKVEGNQGKTLSFTYEDGRLASVVDSEGKQLSYAYNDLNLLSSVTFPSQKSRTYHYEHGTLPYEFYWALTGITDENGHRYSNWTYDGFDALASGYFSNDGSSVELYQFNYSNVAKRSRTGSVTITNPLGKSTRYSYTTIGGARKVTSIYGYASSNCASANQYYTYYEDGHVNAGQIKTTKDWEGNTTAFEYNDRGLETKKTEAQGTPDQKITLTEWHPTFNLPTKITEGSTQTEMTYDSEGKLISQTQSQVLVQ